MASTIPGKAAQNLLLAYPINAILDLLVTSDVLPVIISDLLNTPLTLVYRVCRGLLGGTEVVGFNPDASEIRSNRQIDHCVYVIDSKLRKPSDLPPPRNA